VVLETLDYFPTFLSLLSQVSSSSSPAVVEKFSSALVSHLNSADALISSLPHVFPEESEKARQIQDLIEIRNKKIDLAIKFNIINEQQAKTLRGEGLTEGENNNNNNNNNNGNMASSSSSSSSSLTSPPSQQSSHPVPMTD
jgi:hypothetical protein